MRTESPVDESEYVLTSRVVRAHNSPRDAWVVVDGHVYDVTMFLERHPGGAAVLEAHLGEDVSELMRGRDRVGAEADKRKQRGRVTGRGGGEHVAEHLHEHSQYAFNLLKQYHIAPLSDANASEAAAVAMDGTLDEHGVPLVDFSKPLLHQIGALGGRYARWVHSFPTSDHTVKLFANDTLESLTKCPWYVPLAFWLPVMAFISYHVFAVVGCDVLRTFVPLALAGFAFWQWFEYLLHRFVFHAHTSGYWSNIAHFLIHGHHHLAPQDYSRLVFPPIPAILVSAPVWAAALGALGYVPGACFLFGFGVGYLNYDMTHFVIHHGVPRLRFLRAQKRRHVHHHFKAPNANFGISNPVLDVLLGTLQRQQQQQKQQ